MRMTRCTSGDVPRLAAMNKRLIEDEKSSNPMNVSELETRMAGFLAGEYAAFFFEEGDTIIGYALVRSTSSPPYLRQFYIDRDCRRRHYGEEAFRMLLACLKTDSIDVDVLPWNGAGRAFWSSLGFTETCISMNYKG